MPESFRGSIDSLLLPALGVHDGARIIESSPELASMFGHGKAEALIGRSPLEFIAPSRHDEILRQALAGDNTWHETVGVRANGDAFPIEISGRLVRHHGTPARVILVRDLSPISLVVDDELVVAKMTAVFLEQLGYRTLVAEAGSTVLEFFQAGKLALMVLDVVMPIMDGIELGRKIRAADPAQPILYMSGYTEKQVQFDETSGFLSKPFGIEELRKAIRNLPERARKNTSI